jgi:glutaryl-CoA dehydrogenase
VSTYAGFDFYRIDELLTDEQRAIRDTVRAWTDEKVLPIIEKHYQDGTFPMHLAREMGEMGFLGANLKGYECPGLDNVAYGLICQELERGDSAIRSFCSVQGSLVMYPIHAYGSEEQKNKWLPRLAKGEAIGCFGLTEPDFGSNPSGMITKAEDKGRPLPPQRRQDVDHERHAGRRGRRVGQARRRGPRLPRRARRQGLLRPGDDGQTQPPRVRHLGARVPGRAAPKDAILPGVKGLKGPLGCLTNARYGIAWGALGAAQGCLHSANEYAKSRIQFDKPDRQLPARPEQARVDAARDHQGPAPRVHASAPQGPGQAHARAGQPGQDEQRRHRAADRAGGARRPRRQRHPRRVPGDAPHAANLESVFTYEGTHDIHNLVLGRWLTGVAAFT